MRLKASIEFDTTEPTELESQEPSGFVASLKSLFFETPADFAVESFNMHLLLKQLAASLQALKLNNLIRLSYNRKEFYFDVSNKPNDFSKVLKDFRMQLVEKRIEECNMVTFAVESRKKKAVFLVDVVINRIHPPGVKPVRITVNALVDEGGREALVGFSKELEKALVRFISVDDLKITHESIDYESSSDKLFPLLGVTLGKTTKAQLKKLGKHATMLADNGKPYRYYTIEGESFWYHGHKKAVNMYLTRSNTLPEPWRKLGLTWANTFAQWRKALEKIGCTVTVTHEPRYVKTEKFGKSFEATLLAIYSIEAGTFDITVDFAYNRGMSKDDKDTAYSMTVWSRDR